MNLYPYPRDIRSPNSAIENKFHSILELLCSLATRKPCAMVAGGFMFVGSIRMLCKWRRWICRRMATATRKTEGTAPRVDAGTQTDLVGECLTSDHKFILPCDKMNMTGTRSNQETGSSYTGTPVAATGLFSHPSRSPRSPPDSSEEFPGNTVTTRDGLGNCIACGFNSPSINEQQTCITHVTQRPNHLCQLSFVMALMALHKVSSSEKSISSATYHCQRTVTQDEQTSLVDGKSLFEPGIKPVARDTRKPKRFSFMQKAGLQDSGKSEKEQAASEQSTCPKTLVSSFAFCTTRGLAPDEPPAHPSERQISGTTRKSRSLRVDSKPFFPPSNSSSGAQEPSPEEEAGTNQASARSKREETFVVERKQRGGRNYHNRLRPERTVENGWRQRGKTKGQIDRRRNNVPHLEHADFENAPQVASQQNFRSDVRQVAQQRAHGEIS